jgi:hypothetical protein
MTISPFTLLLLFYLALARVPSSFSAVAAQTPAAWDTAEVNPRVIGMPGLLVVRSSGQTSFLACVSDDGDLLAVSKENCPLNRFRMSAFWRSHTQTLFLRLSIPFYFHQHCRPQSL